jgi:predicted house-cleaning noncanonical NTP pyrophosphatase (MazG superfamily)
MNGNDYSKLANDLNQMAKHYESKNYLEELREVINLAKGIAHLFENNRDNFDYDTFVKKVNNDER